MSSLDKTGYPDQIESNIYRVRANNPGIMTGNGTNTYIIGSESFCVIDPGPIDEQHIENILAFTNRKISLILVTHTHSDHSPASTVIAAETGASIAGKLPMKVLPTDPEFIVDVLLEDDQVLNPGKDKLTVIATPGHASNHLCYLDMTSGMLFSGDHIMQGSTVVINPPDGDMTDYLCSLNKLKQYPIRQIAPGHGHVIQDWVQEVDTLIDHRIEREKAVLSCVHTNPGRTAMDLVQHVYPDITLELMLPASRSLLAHLIKLEQDSAVIKQQGCWYPA